MKKKLLWICLLNVCVQHSYAEDSQNSEELNKVESGITTVRENMERLAQQKEEQQVLLADIEQHYGETAAALKELHLKIEQKRKSLTNIRLDMLEYQKEVNKLSQELAAQIRAAYAMGQQEALKLLLSQKDPALSHRMMAYFNAINNVVGQLGCAIRNFCQKSGHDDQKSHTV